MSQSQLLFVDGAELGAPQLLELRILLQLLHIGEYPHAYSQQLLVVVALHHVVLEAHGYDAEISRVGLCVRVLGRVEDAVGNVHEIALVARVIVHVAIRVEVVARYGLRRRGGST